MMDFLSTSRYLGSKRKSTAFEDDFRDPNLADEPSPNIFYHDDHIEGKESFDSQAPGPVVNQTEQYLLSSK